MKNSTAFLTGIGFASAVFVLSGMQGPTKQKLLTLSPEQAEMLSHMSIVYLPDGQGGSNKTIRFEGVNVQVVSGSGATSGPENGRGNLIVGYNEFNGSNPYGDARTGSHCLIVGDRNSYSSFGCLLAGAQNAATKPYAAVSGGSKNKAGGSASSVSGGSGNVASQDFSWIGGGQSNSTTGGYSAIVGGYQNEAVTRYSAIVGGWQNYAGGPAVPFNAYTVVVGGHQNSATGVASTVSGGFDRDAPGEYDWVAGSLFEDN